MPRQKPRHLPTAEANFKRCNVNDCLRTFSEKLDTVLAQTVERRLNGELQTA